MNLLEAVGHTPLVELMNAGTKPAVPSRTVPPSA